MSGTFRDAQARRPRPINSESFSAFEGKAIPPIDWLIPGVLVKGGVTLFSGQGGKGKSLLCMQMQAALALGQDWLGIPVKCKMASYALYCEDERDVLHHRMDAVRQHYRCSFTDLEEARFVSRVGQSNELMRFWGNKADQGEVTALFQGLREDVAGWHCPVLIIDTVADAFGGNENFRSQVRTFVGALRSIVLPVGGGIILNAHPSRAGMADGSGMSGSTAWEASVRTRINLTEPRKADDEDENEQKPTTARVLKVMKSNYGPAGLKWKLEWNNGVFVRTDQGSAPTSLIDQLDVQSRLVAAAEYLIKNGTYLSADRTSRTALTALAQKLPSCLGLTFNMIDRAQAKLIESGKLVRVYARRDRKWRECIRPAYMNYPDEKALSGQPALHGLGEN